MTNISPQFARVLVHYNLKYSYQGNINNPDYAKHLQTVCMIKDVKSEKKEQYGWIHLARYLETDRSVVVERTG